jgi:hypothetical protein
MFHLETKTFFVNKQKNLKHLDLKLNQQKKTKVLLKHQERTKPKLLKHYFFLQHLIVEPSFCEQT